MKSGTLLFGLVVSIPLLCGGCGGDEEQAPEEVGEKPGEVEPEKPKVLRVDESVFLEFPELKNETPEYTAEIYESAEAKMTDELLLKAVKETVSPTAKKLLEQWEKDPLFIRASHFGQTRFIIVFAGTSTGDEKEDSLIMTELGAALSSHAREVIDGLIEEAKAAKAAGAADPKAGEPAPPGTP